MQPTHDPDTFIEEQTPEGVIYRSGAERWIISGVCVACGSCEVGAVNDDLIWTEVPVGQPGACLDRRYGHRLDVPVRPEISRLPGCTLTGAYL